MNITREIKSLILVLFGVVLFIIGFNFLKGTSVFNDEIKLYTIFDNVEGLQTGTSITVSGLNVGKVTSIDFLNNSTSILVSFVIRDDIKFSKNSIAELYEAGLIGGKSIAIIPKFDKFTVFKSGDTLKSQVKAGLTQTISNRIVPLESKIESILTQADTLFIGLNQILDKQAKKDLNLVINNLSGTIKKINSLSSVIDQILSKQSKNINNSINNFSLVSSNLKKFSDSLVVSDINNTVKDLKTLTQRINKMLLKIDKGSGTLSKIINNDDLYENLDSATKELYELLNDLKMNPKRYVQFSIFGKKQEDYKKNENR